MPHRLITRIITLTIMVAALTGLVAALRQLSATITPDGTTVTVTGVIDGDTFDAATPDGTTVRIRLLGVDAPETSHNGSPADCGADQATLALNALISNQTVFVEADPAPENQDAYDRLLRYVSLNGDDIAATLIRDGMVAAWHPTGVTPPSRHLAYQAAQLVASTTKTGSWATCDTLGR